ncbi:MAG TPA: histidine kinase [Bacteroidota bacterium]|nr:histidine kinase [Bacteroidota bacterium]
MNRKEILRSLAFMAVITLVVAAGLTYANPANWAKVLVCSLVFTLCIGSSIHGMITLAQRRLAGLGQWARLSVLFLIYLVAGFAGTEIGYFLLRSFLYSGTLDLGSHVRLLLFNLVLATIFGSVAFVYYSLLGRASAMARTLREKEINEERLERLRMRAELDALQAKVNPHFLFNTLNSIASLISENPAAAEATVEKLSGLFRYTLQRGQQGDVALSEELEIVRTYLEIEKVRFGDRLRFSIRAGEGAGEVRVPPLIIQPLVENSIKHAIAADPAGGSIEVDAALAGSACVITVTDSGPGFEPSEGGFGLKSISDRLKLVYGERASIGIAHDGISLIRISIPVDMK